MIIIPCIVGGSMEKHQFCSRQFMEISINLKDKAIDNCHVSVFMLQEALIAVFLTGRCSLCPFILSEHPVNTNALFQSNESLQ